MSDTKALLEAIPGLARINTRPQVESRNSLAQDEWDESKHKRAENGQFGSGGGEEAATVHKKGDKVRDRFGKEHTVLSANESNVKTYEGGSFHPTKVHKVENSGEGASKKEPKMPMKNGKHDHTPVSPADKKESTEYYQDLQRMHPDDLTELYEKTTGKKQRVTRAFMIDSLHALNYGHLDYKPSIDLTIKPKTKRG